MKLIKQTFKSNWFTFEVSLNGISIPWLGWHKTLIFENSKVDVIRKLSEWLKELLDAIDNGETVINKKEEDEENK